MQDRDNLISRRTHKLSCQSFQFTVQTDIHVCFFPVEGQLCGNIDWTLSQAPHLQWGEPGNEVSHMHYADSTDLYTFLCPDALSVDSGTGNGNTTRRKEVGMSVQCTLGLLFPLTPFPPHIPTIPQILPIQIHLVIFLRGQRQLLDRDQQMMMNSWMQSWAMTCYLSSDTQ